MSVFAPPVLTTPAIDPAAATAGRAAAVLERSTPLPAESGFARELDQAAARRGRAREAADQLLASAFVLPVLQQVRDSPFKSELFHGGRAEEVFGQQLDVILAERITQAADLGVADALTQRLAPSPPESGGPSADNDPQAQHPLSQVDLLGSVSYTHLTLPTIYSV